MRPIIEGFAIETVEGLIFTVKGLLHPPDRVIAYLRYLPDPQGDRLRDGSPYRRVYHFEEQEQLLGSRYPDYLGRDPVLGIRVQGVPRSRIRRVHDPCAYLEHLRRRGPADRAEADAWELVSLLQETTAVPWDDLGVSGSLMLSTHRPDSDIDLLVYGEESARAVHRALVGLLQEESAPLRRPHQGELEGLHAAHRRETPLSLPDFIRAQMRKANEGRFRDRPFFVRFVKRPAETGERYGDRRFHFIRRVTMRVIILDDRDAIFTPCCYRVNPALSPTGQPAGAIREIVSYRGRFSDQVRADETAEACGNLERVESGVGETYHRLVIGGQAGDYLLAAGDAGRGQQAGAPVNRQ
jgi:predicted nucleotidyltransferase